MALQGKHSLLTELLFDSSQRESLTFSVELLKMYSQQALFYYWLRWHRRGWWGWYRLIHQNRLKQSYFNYVTVSVTNKLEFEEFESFIFYRLPTKLWKLIFSVMCVYQSVHRGKVPCDHCPWCIGPHCTGPQSQYPLCTGPVYVHIPGLTPFTGPQSYPPLMTSGGQDWKSVQTCSLEDLTVQGYPPVLTSGVWLLK